jgi:hypothetical protein
VEDQKNREKGENYQLYELARAKGIKVKSNRGGMNRRDVEVDCHCLEEDGGTSWRLEVDAGEGYCWLRSRGCSSELPPERENAKGWSLRVEDERSGEIYL